MTSPTEELLKVACGSTDPLELTLRGGAVRRFHSEGRGFDQDVAQHSWRVMVIMRYLWPETRSEALLHALYHDISEALTGDVPAPIKRVRKVREAIATQSALFTDHIGLSETVTDIEHKRMKCADYLEMCLTCLDVPGRNARHVFWNGISFIREAATRLDEPDEQKVLKFVEERLVCQTTDSRTTPFLTG